MAHRAWTSERTRLPGRVEARVRAGGATGPPVILLDAALPDPLPAWLWAEYVAQADAFLAGDTARATHCRPHLRCLDGGAAAVPRADAG